MNKESWSEDKPLPLYECSLVVQGEGKFAGIPHILIRTLGCALRCGFCVEENTEITTTTGQNKATTVAIGNRVETPHGISTIIDKQTKIVNSVFEIELEDGRIIQVTEDHPFMTIDGNEIQAQNLYEGIELVVMR